MRTIRPRKIQMLQSFETTYDETNRTESVVCPVCEMINKAQYREQNGIERLVPVCVCRHYSDMVELGGFKTGFMFWVWKQNED